MTCICTVCQCGRHRCPKRPSTISFESSQDDGRTKYQADYMGRPTDPRKGFKPMTNLRASTEPFDGVSCNQMTYVAHQMEPRYMRPPDVYKPSSEPLEHLTTHQDSFRSWPSTRREAVVPQLNYTTPSGRFEGTTKYQEDFEPRPMELRKGFKPMTNLKASSEPFDGVSCNQMTYVAHQMEPRYMRPPDVYKPSSEPLQDLTTHQDSFRSWPSTRREAVVPQLNYTTPSGRFEGTTKYQEDFEPRPMELRKGFKPMTNLKASSEPFDGVSCNQMTYVTHPMEPRYMRPPDVYKPSSEPLQNHTSYSDAYICHDMKPAMSFKPANQGMVECSRMEDGTTYNTTFTQHRMNVCPANYDPPPGYVVDNSSDMGHKYLRKL